MKKDQFGPWLRATVGKLGEEENRGNRASNPPMVLKSETTGGSKVETVQQSQGRQIQAIPAT